MACGGALEYAKVYVWTCGSVSMSFSYFFDFLNLLGILGASNPVGDISAFSWDLAGHREFSQEPEQRRMWGPSDYL